MTTTRTEEIAVGIYWVGGCAQDGGLHCNPYLIVDGDEGVLIDPGSYFMVARSISFSPPTYPARSRCD